MEYLHLPAPLISAVYACRFAGMGGFFELRRMELAGRRITKSGGWNLPDAA
jgi:hypothetical protein